MEAGQPIGYFRGFVTNGIFQNQDQIDESPILNSNTQPGDLIFVDLNEDGIINDLDKTNIGDPIPDATMGLNLSFDLYNFDFGAYAFASVGNDIVRNYERNLPLTNRSIQYLNRWRGEGTSNSFPRVTTGATNNTLFSDFYVEDGSFIRLQNVQLGYSLGADTAKKWGITKLRFYISAQNLVTLTKYSGYDEQDYQDALISAYDLLQSTYFNVMLGEIASDNTLAGGENANDVPGIQEVDDMIHTPINQQVRDIWKLMYAGINRANYIMEFKDKTDFPGKAGVLAQTRFLRAYYYFELVKWFGDVPFAVDQRIQFGDQFSIGRTPKTEIYAQLEQDLIFAADNLPYVLVLDVFSVVKVI